MAQSSVIQRKGKLLASGSTLTRSGSCCLQGSKQRLETAMKALERQNVYDPDLLIYKSALNIIRSASLNCYLFEVWS